MAVEGFEVLPLHDALLRSVELDWERKSCTFQVLAFATPAGNATPHVLSFEGVTFLSIPHNEPWGPSSRMNSVSSADAKFSLEMQSGDVIELTATSFSFRAL